VQQAREMIAVSAEGNKLKIEGFAGKPSLSRSTRNHICIIINGRYVRCPVVAGAVEEAYRTMLPYGRKPVAVLSLSIMPELLDINVHPAKFEVQLLEEEDVVGAVINALQETLRTREVIPPATGHHPMAGTLFSTGAIMESSTENYHQKKVSSNTQATMLVESMTVEEDNEYINRQDAGATRIATEIVYPMKEKESGGQQLPFLSALAQLPPTYILAAGEDGLYIIDQHAAHERVLYERHMAVKDKNSSQYLLVPVTLELAYREADILTDRILWFTDAGFVIEHFGGNTFLLRGVPLHLPAGQGKELFMDMVEYFRERGPGASKDEFCNQLASALACRNAVKAGERLPLSSMNALLRRLAQTINPFTCPHGRPTIIRLSYKDLERRFKR